MLNVDYLLGVCLTKALLPSMTARGGGRLINISSIVGKVGFPLCTAYCGAKHAMRGFFDALRVEEFARGLAICVTNICLGSTRTNVARNAVGSTVGQLRG
jgi:dehydrogenase/reductase SDR family protein 7B